MMLEQTKAEALSAVYQYVASRLESVDQRCSVPMILSGSFVSYLVTAKNVAIGAGADTLLAILYRPSILLGLLAFLCFYMSQSVRIKQQNDLISRCKRLCPLRNTSRPFSLPRQSRVTNGLKYQYFS